MKTQEEIEQIAEKLYPVSPNPKQMIEGFERVAFKKGYSQCQEDNKDEYRWTYSEIFDACFPTLGRGGDWAAIAKRLIEQKENKQD